jgi:hypothetical protein
MLLTEEEIRELTNRKQRSAQAMVLNALGITHKVRPDGSLVVLRAHVEHELGYRTPPAKQEKEFKPDWGAIAVMEAEDAERRKLQQKAKIARGHQVRKKPD